MKRQRLAWPGAGWQRLGALALLAGLMGCAAAPPAGTVVEPVTQAAPAAQGSAQALPTPWVVPEAAPPAALRLPGLSLPQPLPGSQDKPIEPALRLPADRPPGEASGMPALRLPPSESPVLLDSGQASWYADKFHGRRTANGERYDREEFTAAHRSLPFGARLCVRSLVNGRTVIVRVNDRGPFAPGRIIDLSRAAAEELGMLGLGIKPVELWRMEADDDGCPDSLEQPVEGGGLGLDGAAAAKGMQQAVPAPRKAAAARGHTARKPQRSPQRPRARR